jgi:hypothetical protein
MEVISDTQMFAVFFSFAVLFVIICIQVYIRLPPTTPTKNDKEYKEYVDYINAKYERELEKEKEQERERNERFFWLG